MRRKKVRGMKRVDVVRLRLVRENSFYAWPTVQSPGDAHRLFRRLIGAEMDREFFVLLCLDAKHRSTTMQILAIGTLNGLLVHPREVFKTAILANSDSFICAHSHPSGDPEPSVEDVKVTQRLMRTGKIVGIPLLDHLILGADHAYVSLKERALLDYR